MAQYFIYYQLTSCEHKALYFVSSFFLNIACYHNYKFPKRKLIQDPHLTHPEDSWLMWSPQWTEGSFPASWFGDSPDRSSGWNVLRRNSPSRWSLASGTGSPPPWTHRMTRISETLCWMPSIPQHPRSPPAISGKQDGFPVGKTWEIQITPCEDTQTLFQKHSYSSNLLLQRSRT